MDSKAEFIVLIMLGCSAIIYADVCETLCKCDHGFVNCSRNDLTTIPSGIPLNTTSLDLSYNKLTFVQISSLKDMVNLSSIDLSDNNLSDTSIDVGALDLPKLETIDLSYNQMNNFPSQSLPKSLTKLYFIQNNISSLAPNTFVNISKLEYLDMSNNQISALPSGLLNNLPNLETFYIPFNNLTNNGILYNAFVSNTKLSLLGLRFNQLSQILPNLPISLQALDYAGNKIKTIPSRAFESLPNLTAIALWMGEVENLEENAFSGLSKLEYLDMMQDKVGSNITNTTFSDLVSLKNLVLDLNNISYIDPLAFQSFLSIETLWLSDNKLSSLDPHVLDEKRMPHISEVYIDGNPWYCDCHLKWLKEKSEQSSSIIQTPHLMVCSGPPSLKGRPWDEINSKDFVCS